MTPTILIPTTSTVAALALANWRPDPASVGVTDRGEIVVALRTGDGRLHERRFSPTALRPPRAVEPPGALVLLEHGERLVLAPDGSDTEIALFADALAAARAFGCLR
jgi:hypothetical protein